MLFRAIILLIVTIFVSKSSCQKNIVDELKERFYDESTVCFDAQNKSQPIYKCSGIIIRGIRNYSNATKFAWSLKPTDIEKNSFSFGFLRQDLRFSHLGKGYDAGFIIYPHLSTPSEKNTQKAVCGFPIDARTDLRSDRGCGLRNNDTIGTSRQCSVQNITTFTQWLSHYNNIINSEDPRFEIRQCGFDLSDSVAAQNFAVIREANLYLQNNSRLAFANSELRLEGWDENNAKQIPIQSFFYFIDSENGYENAVKYQSDFYTESGGEKVPIVGIRLPTASNPDIQIQKGHMKL